MESHRSSSILAYLAVILLLAAIPGYATIVSGDITTHVTWAAHSDITIVDGITVTSTGWLTIEEGVSIDGLGVATFDVDSLGKLEIGEDLADPVTITGIVSMNLYYCGTTTPIINTEFTSCGDPNGIAPFIILSGNNGDGFQFFSCVFSEIESPAIQCDEEAEVEIKDTGYFQWAGGAMIYIAPGGSIDPVAVNIHDNDFDGSTCGYFQWAGAPIVSMALGGVPHRIIFEGNTVRGQTNEMVGVYISDAAHDDGLGAGIADIDISGNIFDDLETGIVIEGGAEANSVSIHNNVIYNSETGISIDHSLAEATLAAISNNAIFDNTTAIYTALDGSGLVSGLSITNNIAWENEVGFDFQLSNSASIDDILFRNNVAGESSTAAFRSNTAVGQGSIHHMGLKGNTSNIKVGGNNGDADRFAGDCVIDGSGSKYFDFVNENPDDSTGWDFHLLVDDTWSGDYNDLINVGYGDDPDGNTADIGLFGGAFAEANIDQNYSIVDNYRSVTSIEFFNDVTSWKPDIYRVNIVSPSLDMTSTGTVDGGSSEYQTTIQVPNGTTLSVGGNFDVEYANFTGIGSSTWSGFKFTSTTDVEHSGLSNCTISNATYGVYLTSVYNTNNDRLPIVDCSIIDCGNGVYANQSWLYLSGVTISGSNGSSFGGSGVYLTSCASGKVLIDSCIITNNGKGSGVSSAGIYLSNSSPEITNTLIEDNSGAGITSYSSTPDLNTWDSGSASDRPNSIHSNGGVVQTGSNGSEIYLSSSSYPEIRYNNIWDYSGGPIGYMIYKNATSNSGALSAKNNWWGANPSASFFYWGGGSAIDYADYSGSQLSNARVYQQALSAWEEGDFERAAQLFGACLSDEGPLGINSIRYLSGCYAEIPDADYSELRSILCRTALTNRDESVASVARRFATDCLTELGEYRDALEEYQEAIEHARCVEDSVTAAIDWLSVYELADGGHHARSEGFDVPGLMSKAIAELDRATDATSGTLPGRFVLEAAYPNPFNSTTRISFALPVEAAVKITVNDISGRQVAELYNGMGNAGTHSLVWEANSASAGLYFVKAEMNGQISSQKVLLVK